MFILAAGAASAVCHEPGTAGDAKELLLSDSFSIAKFGVAGKRSKPPNRPTFYRALTAGQNRAHGDDQNLMEVVQRGVVRTRILQPISALDTFSKTPAQRRFARNRAESLATKTHSPSIRDQVFKCDSLAGGSGRKNEAHCGKSLAKGKKLWF
jgi:hypothetical protein